MTRVRRANLLPFSHARDVLLIILDVKRGAVSLPIRTRLLANSNRNGVNASLEADAQPRRSPGTV